MACASFLLGAAGCAQDATGCATAPYAASGPYVAGVTRLDVAGTVVEVWYPADRGVETGRAKDVYDMRDFLPESLRASIPADAPTTFTTDAYRDVPASGAGPFPLVLFSHGLGGYRLQSSFLMTHLASWGYVVAAPEHAERDLANVLAMGELADNAYQQLLDTAARMQAENTTAGGRLFGRIDSTKLAVMGHSAGGGAVQGVVDQGMLGADVWVGMATVAYPQTTPSGLILGGTTDMLARQEAVTNGYEELMSRPRRLVVIEGAGHLAFSDICTIGRERGGVLQIARDAGLMVPDLVVLIGTDGCRPTDLPPEMSWPITRHYVTAHLEAALRGQTRGLGDDSKACFGALLNTYRHD